MELQLFKSFLFVLIMLTGRLVDAIEKRVAGGYIPDNPYDLGKYFAQLRFKAELFYGQNFYCGGVILSKRSVLTCAHCFASFDGILLTTHHVKIVVGSVERFEPSSGTVMYDVKTVYMHKEYNQYMENDIAVVVLKQEIDLVPGQIDVVKLPIEKVKPGSFVTVVGFGKIFDGGPESHELKFGDLQVYDDNKCYSLIDDYEEDIFICAGPRPGGSASACKRDTCAPLFFEDIVVGLVGWQEGCKNESNVGIFVNIHHYLDWVLRNDTTKVKSKTLLIFMAIILWQLLGSSQLMLLSN